LLLPLNPTDISQGIVAKFQQLQRLVTIEMLLPRL
jgi:hypothetical protein